VEKLQEDRLCKLAILFATSKINIKTKVLFLFQLNWLWGFGCLKNQRPLRSANFKNIFLPETRFYRIRPSLCYCGYRWPPIGNWAGTLAMPELLIYLKLTTNRLNKWTLQLKGAGENPLIQTADAWPQYCALPFKRNMCAVWKPMYHLGANPFTRGTIPALP